MIKVCHLTSVHKPTDIRIFDKECLTLSKNGYEVYLVATGESYIRDGVNVIGVGEKPSSRLKRMLITTRKVYKSGLALNCEVYHIHDPELLPYAILLKRKGKKVIFDSHENVYEQILKKSWVPVFMRQFIARMYRDFEKFVVKRIDGVAIVTPAQIPSFNKLQKNLQMITNFPVLDNKSLQRNLNRSRCKIDYQICFAGGIDSRWNHQVIAKTLVKIPNLKYCFAGPSSDKYLTDLLHNPAWNRQLIYLGVVDQKSVANLYEASFCGMALLNYNTEVKKIGSIGVTKIFEYMKYGLPIICSDLILWKEIIDKYDCGITVDPTNIQEIADALNFLIENPEEAQRMGMNGYKAYIEEYNWDTQVPKLLQLYSELIK